MLVGHAGLALGLRAKNREVPLGTLMAAAFALDLIWPIFLLLGIEEVSIRPGATAYNPLVFTSYPWTHSLAMAGAWGLAAWLLVRSRGYRGAVATLAGLVVVSHWVLDAVVHTADLPLWPGSTSPLAGLGLWNSLPATMLAEGIIFVTGIGMYWRSTNARNAAGDSGFWGFVFVLGILWVSAPFLPAPSSASAVAVGALLLWLVPFWAAWFDGNRGRATSAGEAIPVPDAEQ